MAARRARHMVRGAWSSARLGRRSLALSLAGPDVPSSVRSIADVIRTPGAIGGGREHRPVAVPRLVCANTRECSQTHGRVPAYRPVSANTWRVREPGAVLTNPVTCSRTRGVVVYHKRGSLPRQIIPTTRRSSASERRENCTSSIRKRPHWEPLYFRRISLRCDNYSRPSLLSWNIGFTKADAQPITIPGDRTETGTWGMSHASLLVQRRLRMRYQAARKQPRMMRTPPPLLARSRSWTRPPGPVDAELHLQHLVLR